MRHAGISVTVTSITDVMAFGLGAFTIMPGLQVGVIIIIIVKMAIILPTGQWYAPSAVINDAWYCLVLHCIA